MDCGTCMCLRKCEGFGRSTRRRRTEHGNTCGSGNGSAGPEHTGDFKKYENLTYHGISVAAILGTYNSAMVQPNPLFSGEMNYLANKLLSIGVTDIHQTFPEETVILDGEDFTAQVKEAWNFLVEHGFVM